MLLNRCDGIEWLEFELFASEKKLKHKIFLKHGGYSEGCYSSLNFSYSVGDSEEAVRKNFDKAKKEFPEMPFILGKYSHGSDLFEIKNKIFEKKAFYDGLLTESPYVGLMVTHADCQAGIIFDPIKGKLANVHCGWRGNLAKIYTKTIQYMKERWGCAPEDMLVGISPSLGPLHAEFVNYKVEFPSHLHEYVDNMCRADLWKMTEDELLLNKILPHHMQIARLCTYSDSNNYFSFRRDKITGRHMTIAYLVE